MNEKEPQNDDIMNIEICDSQENLTPGGAIQCGEDEVRH